MNLIVKQDIIGFHSMVDTARDKIRDLMKLGRYSEPHLKQVEYRLCLAKSAFTSAIANSMKYSELEEIMNSIGKGGEE